MILLNNRNVKFFYSLNKNFYDIICIGNKAQKVARLVEQKNKGILLKKLFIKSSDTQFQPSLSFLGQGQIKLKNTVGKNTDTKLRNQITKIDPNKNVLELRNGEQLRYKHLIYSGQDNQWKDYDSIKGLKQGIQCKYTSTYADIQGSEVGELYNKVNCEIYFNIGSDRHFATDNLFMLHLADHLRNISIDYGYDPSSTKIKILNKGQKLIPFNSEIDSLVRNLLEESNIEIINDCNVQSISHRERKFTVNINGTQKDFKYDGFYQYLPFKVPQIFNESQMDPLNVDQMTLINKEFPNVHIIGNIVPTVYSFYTLNYMANTMAENIIKTELKSRDLAVYEGDSIFPLWTGVNSLRHFHLNYEKTKSLNNIGQNKIPGLILALDRKLIAKREVSMYYNGRSYGWPFYFTSPRLNTGVNLMKNLEKKTLAV